MSVLTPLEQVRALPIPERLELLFQVWDELLDAGWKPSLSPEHKAELDRRIADYEANPSNVRTWEQIEARLKSSKHFNEGVNN